MELYVLFIGHLCTKKHTFVCYPCSMQYTAKVINLVDSNCLKNWTQLSIIMESRCPIYRAGGLFLTAVVPKIQRLPTQPAQTIISGKFYTKGYYTTEYKIGGVKL